MRSRLTEQLRRELLEADRKLTPEERLQAFLEHSQLMVKLNDAGKALRDSRTSKKEPR